MDSRAVNVLSLCTGAGGKRDEAKGAEVMSEIEGRRR